MTSILYLINYANINFYIFEYLESINLIAIQQDITFKLKLINKKKLLKNFLLVSTRKLIILFTVIKKCIVLALYNEAQVSNFRDFLFL